MTKWLIVTVFVVIIALLLGTYYKTNEKYKTGQEEKIDFNGDQYWGVAKMQGRRNYMEDTTSQLIKDDFQLFGVYDGHANDVS